ncbi:MAG: hypothetical protein LBL00_08325, partial [Endomicrobium sp.]|nr:hypothetical protein [Endomicrobium sp.]
DSNLIETFSDSITGGADSGIRIYCYVVEEDSKTLNSNDGFIPDMSPTTLTGQYGTYKFYVIKSSAVIYSDYKNSMGEIAAAKDELHFFIAYSSGPVGARGYENITEADGTVVQGLRLLPGGLGVSTPEYIKSAPNRSFLTGKVLPIFRYYIRGRR